jgi:flagellar hook assembly protein FlgD
LSYSYSTTDYVGSDRVTSTTSTSGSSWNIVTTDSKNNSDLDFSDFLMLMVEQLKNQDFMDPVDNAEYMAQLTQFASVQAMNELASYSKTNYAMSLVGKEVTASRYTASGGTDTTTGTVEKVSLVNSEYVLYVGGKTYSLDQITQVSEPKADGECAVDPSSLKVQYSNVTNNGFNISWSLPTEDTSVQKNITYQAYYSTEAPFNSVEEVTQNGTAFGGKIKNATSDDALTADISGLDSATTYYVNVLVTDEKGNQAVYSPTVLTTKRA